MSKAKQWVAWAAFVVVGAAVGSMVTDIPHLAGAAIGAAGTGFLMWFLYIREEG